jgi:AcrR family transcriptional regulator
MNKKEMKTAQTKKKLQQAFLELYSEIDIDKISVRTITDIAGYNRATFYIHYTDVYQLRDMIEETLLKEFNHNADRILSSINEYDITPLIKMISSLYQDYGDTLPILLTHSNSSFAGKVKSLARTKFLKNCHGLSPEDKIKLGYLIEYQLSAVIGLASYWRNNQDFSFENLLSIIKDVSSKGIVPSIAKVLNKYAKMERLILE